MSRTLWKTTCHQGGTRGSALSLDIEIQQSQALAGKFIDAQSWRTTQNAATIDAQLTITDIVGENQNDVGLPRICKRRLKWLFLDAGGESGPGGPSGDYAGTGADKQTAGDISHHALNHNPAAAVPAARRA